MSVNLIEHLSRIPDPRDTKNRRYPLEEILFLCISAIISGAEGWEAIERFGHAKLDWLRRFLPMTNGIPSHDTVAWVMARLSPRHFQSFFVDWVQNLAQVSEGEIISIDGKTARRSYDTNRSKSAIHMVSAWASLNQVSMGQIMTDEKSNEITAIPALLELLEIKGGLVTIDAMGCQTAIAEQIVDKQADYALAVKGNQGRLFKAIDEYFTQALEDDFEQVNHTFFETIDKGHGRLDQRRYWLVPDLSTLPDTQRWKKLSAIGMAERTCRQNGEVTVERRYYILSFDHDVERFAQAVRCHWGVENKLHWVLDVVFREDESRIRRGHAPANFNTMRQTGLNLLRKEPSKTSIKQKRFEAALNDRYRTKLLF